jgi:glycosyltransferase involved in cell wall biosynthesis
VKVLFDLSSIQPVTGNDFHGGSEYAKTVFYKICELLPSDVTLEVFYNPLNNIEDAILKICKAKGFAINKCLNNVDISKLLCRKKYDIFYSALPYTYFNLKIPPETKFVYTIHGLRPLEYPADKYELKYIKSGSIKEKTKNIVKHLFYLLFPSLLKTIKTKKHIQNFNKLFSLTKNQIIITVSNHSKFAIALFFPEINRSKIKVLYSPTKKYELDNNQNIEILHSLSLEQGKYILLVGGDRSEKGAYRACRVLHELMTNNCRIPQDIKVLVLGVSHSEPYLRLTKNSHRFEFHDYVSMQELETLYKNTCLFLYPTMNEGFGYPPLEAMKYGILCACSANSAIPEIYGDSVIYFNPHDDTEMSIRILQCFDEEIRREKSQKILNRYQVISNRQEQDLNFLAQLIILPDAER